MKKHLSNMIKRTLIGILMVPWVSFAAVGYTIIGAAVESDNIHTNTEQVEVTELNS